MASVKTALYMQDRVSDKLKAINKNLERTLGLMRQVNANAVSMKSLAKASLKYEEVSTQLYRLGNRMQEVGTHTDRTTKKIKTQLTVWQQIRKSLVGRFALGNIVGNLAMNALYGVRDMITGAIDYASSLVEVQNIVDVAFGKSSKAVDDWAKHTLEAYGINEMNAKKYAGTLASQIQASGISQSQASGMAMSLTGLTGDIASFRNEKIEDVYKKITSGMAGMVMPMRRYGIDLTVASMTEELHRLGIKKKWKEMTQAEKVQIRYNYLMEKTKFMQGDFTKTQYTFANQLRLVQQNWTEYTGMLAEKFLPVLNLILIGTNKLILGLKKMSEIGHKLIPILAGVGVAVLILAGIMIGSWLIPVIQKMIVTTALSIALGGTLQAVGASMIAWFGAGAGALTLVALAIAGVIWGLHKFGFTYTQIFSGFIGTLYYVGSLIWDWLCAPLQFLLTLAQKIGLTFEALGQAKGLEQQVNVLKTYGSLGKEGWARLGVDNRKPWEKTGDSWNMGLAKGKELAQSLKLQTHFPNNTDDPFGNNGKAPGSSPSNPMYTKLSDSDIKALVEVAKINYVNKYVKMSPTVNASFGDVRETADIDGIMNKLTDIIEEAHNSALQ